MLLEATTLNAIIGAAAAVTGAVIGAGTQIYLNRLPKTISSRSLEDKRQLRILRALLGEEGGRRLEIYQASPYYGPLISVLEENKYVVQDRGGRYSLTDKGLNELKAHLMPFLRGKGKGH